MRDMPLQFCLATENKNELCKTVLSKICLMLFNITLKFILKLEPVLKGYSTTFLLRGSAMKYAAKLANHEMTLLCEIVEPRT